MGKTTGEAGKAAGKAAGNAGKAAWNGTKKAGKFLGKLGGLGLTNMRIERKDKDIRKSVKIIKAKIEKGKIINKINAIEKKCDKKCENLEPRLKIREILKELRTINLEDTQVRKKKVHELGFTNLRY